MPLANPVRSITSRRRRVSPGCRKAHSTSEPWTSDFTQIQLVDRPAGGFGSAWRAACGSFIYQNSVNCGLPAAECPNRARTAVQRDETAVWPPAPPLRAQWSCLACQNCVESVAPACEPPPAGGE